MKRLLQVGIFFCVAAVPAISPAQQAVPTFASGLAYVQPPPGFDRACASYGWLCSDTPGSETNLPADELRRLADGVNREVNRATEQVSDREIYGTAERWALPVGGRGDCEDLALEKMHRLLEHGVPANRLAMAVVLDRRGDNHAVLLLRLDEGDLVLDSLTDRLLAAPESGYRMLAMQAMGDRSRWRVAEGFATAHTRSTAAVSGVAARAGGTGLAEVARADR